MKKTTKTWCFVSLVILLSASLIACNDEGSSNSNEDDRSSNVNTNRVIQTPDGNVTVRSDPNDENVRFVDAGSNTNIRVDCSTGNNITFSAGDYEVDVCSE